MILSTQIASGSSVKCKMLELLMENTDLQILPNSNCYKWYAKHPISWFCRMQGQYTGKDRKYKWKDMTTDEESLKS